MTKQIHVITIILIILAVIAVGTVAYFKFSSEDTWLCQSGVWVKHGNPRLSMPTVGCGALTNNNYNINNANLNANNTNAVPAEINVKVDALKAGDPITTPLVVTGSARGWYFEGSFPVKLLDANKQVLAAAPAEAQSDWMTNDWVSFKVNLNFISPQDQEGTLVFMNDNPSGRPELQEKYELPVKIKATQTMTVKAFFGNSQKNPNSEDCSLVYPVDRVVPKTITIGQAALAELLKGPTVNELAHGYYNSIPDGVVINKLTITNGTANADFNDALKQYGGLCRGANMLAQIIQTLKQFPTVKNVEITINGQGGFKIEP